MAARCDCPACRRSGRAAAGPPHMLAYWIKVTANGDGTFTLVNSRNNFSRTYNPR